VAVELTGVKWVGVFLNELGKKLTSAGTHNETVELTFFFLILRVWVLKAKNFCDYAFLICLSLFQINSVVDRRTQWIVRYMCVCACVRSFDCVPVFI